MKWMKYKWVYFLFSGLFIVVGIYSTVTLGFKIGVDFTGGAVISYQIKDQSKKEQIKTTLLEGKEKPRSVQETNNNLLVAKFAELTTEQRNEINTFLKEKNEGAFEEVKFETVGPSMGRELIIKTVIALVVSSSLILLWIAIQFKSVKFGVSAVLAMLHDTLILLGSASILGRFGMEVDYLFVTAMLTILSFSVHDTIVVYDRIREMGRGGDSESVADTAISGTMRRSINNSLTIIIMLVALVALGGESTKWFATILLIGTISGTYSSPFVAVHILVTWEKLLARHKK
ncbi:protein-export membrane protein SecF [Candidatus Woesebacteria bacterium RIFOXYA1_FULL_43_9]|uniref:Protein-export membrane protein SecF n=1 Tax=Candidatus Woesebacteria bacterium RIFOXYA1_FULL_43_9 TaxID=1802534 RepID=A0A1F8CMJ8_9BACT|nr:MAG: protein-export membrane protein SecF [Candidatus Woesebacteria bacterium RIFOXYA1_FULL_43_9]